MRLELQWVRRQNVPTGFEEARVFTISFCLSYALCLFTLRICLRHCLHRLQKGTQTHLIVTGLSFTLTDPVIPRAQHARLLKASHILANHLCSH